VHIETKSVPTTPKAHNANNEIHTSGGIFLFVFDNSDRNNNISQRSQNQQYQL
jgi:hypothetical protein